MKPALAELMALDRVALAARWEWTFGRSAPDRAREELLRQTLAWQLQAEQLGGLNGRDRRGLRPDAGSSSQPVIAGSHLIRVWQGDTHQVTVLEDGFLYAGKTWRSLSAIARAITGTAWSGPVFFGLKR